MTRKKTPNSSSYSSIEAVIKSRRKDPFWQKDGRDIDQVAKTIIDEISLFEASAGTLPSQQTVVTLQKIKAIWVVSGGGSYLEPIIDTPSDNKNTKNSWYLGQDKARLDYALLWINDFATTMPPPPPLMIYNGTKKQNADLQKAIREKIFDLTNAQLYIAPGDITRTIEQVKNFSFPPSIKPAVCRLAILSHSAHLPRILRFMNKYPRQFKNAEIVPLSIKIQDVWGQQQMIISELNNLLGCIARGEAAIEPYSFIRIGSKKDDIQKEVVRVLTVAEGDIMDIFRLSNQGSVRLASFNQREISLEEHKKWFVRKLGDKNVIMLKAEIDGQLAGQVRLEIEGSEAIIGVSTSEKFRGRGVASRLLRGAITKAKQREIAIINAFIRPDNLPSIGLFEKNGWNFSGKQKVSDVLANKYIYEV